MPSNSRSHPDRRRRPARAARRRPRHEAASIDYRDPATLQPYLTPRGGIRSQRATGLSARDQRILARAVKVARELALLPYANRSSGRDRG